MSIKNKIISAITLAAIVLTLTGCNDTNTPSTSGDTDTPTTPAAPQSTELNPTQSTENTPSSAEITESTEDTEGTAAAESSESESPEPFTPPTNNLSGEVSGGIFVLEDGRGMMLYGIGYEPGRNYAATVNKYKEKLGIDINVYSMVAPTHISFYLPEKYSDLSGNEIDHINDINEHLGKDIIQVDAYSALLKHVNEEIYYRTDNHWAQLGAYYAAQEFAKAAGVPFDELSDYDKYEKDGYVGTFYGSSNKNPLIKNNPEKFVYYIPKRDYTTTYYDTDAQNGYESSFFFDPENFGSTAEWNLTYMIGDGKIAHINTSQKNGRRLMILKDSYADSLAPCLFGSFEDIWIVDMRYCTTSALQLAKDNNITDLLFCSCTFSATANNQYKLEEIM